LEDEGTVQRSPEIIFVCLAASVGLFMVFATPPFQAPDEWDHLFRAFQLSEGRLIAEQRENLVGGWIPESIFNFGKSFAHIPRTERKIDKGFVSQFREQPLDADQRVFAAFSNTAPYSPIQYIPQIAAIWLSRILNLSVLNLLYSARGLNLLFYILLSWLAIRLTPMLKWTMVLVCLMPMNIFLAASLSSDPMTNGLIFLLTALVLKAASSAEMIRWSEILPIFFVSILVGLVKQVYFLLPLVTIIIPFHRFASRKRKIAFSSITLCLAIIANVFWLIVVRHIAQANPWANPRDQLAFIFSNPWDFVFIMFSTLHDRWMEYFAGLVGILGWLDTLLPFWLYWSYIPVLICTAFFEKSNAAMKNYTERLVLAGIAVVTSLFIAISVYLTYSYVGETVVRGVQGRYFVPLVMPILLIFSNRRFNIPSRWIQLMIPSYCLVVLVVTCLTIINRYYI